MNFFRWLIRSLLFYRWISLGILLAATAATAILTGSLMVGDSVRISLARQMEDRLGKTHLILLGQETLFRPQLAGDLSTKLNTDAAAILMLYGRIENGDGTRRINRVNVIGVDESFAALSPSDQAPWIKSLPGGLVMNADLAKRLEVEPGDETVLYVQKAGGLSAESILFPESELQYSIRLPVSAVAPADQFGSFGLRADSSGTLNVFVDRQILSQWIAQPGLANALLLGGETDIDTARQALRRVVQPQDLGLTVRKIEDLKFLEVRSRNVFINDELSQALLSADPRAVGVLTYFVNEIAKDNRSAPYSMVSSIGSADPAAENIFNLLADNEIMINEWLANDLRADTGDTLTLTYFVPGSKTSELTVQTKSFRVRSVMPMMGLGADPMLMPDFPALAEVKNCRDWKPGIPIDLAKIRPKDEAYWDKYNGAPKAFISLPEAQRLWANRYGSLTAVRYPISMTESQLAGALHAKLDPSAAGLVLDQIRARGRQAAAGMTDFGSLFAGLSMFLLGSALVLTAMIFHFGIERQTDQIGLLKALGFTARQIRWMYLTQGLVLSVAASLLGVVLALVYTRLLILALSSLWSGAVAGAAVEFHIRISTLFLGAVIGIIASLVSMLLGLRKLMKRPASGLLSGLAELPVPGKAARWNLPVSILLAFAAVLLVVWSLASGGQQAAAVFFGSGFLLLIAVIFFGRWFFHKTGAGSSIKQARSIGYLAFRNLSRRPGRSLAVLATMACGVFLVVAVGLNQKSAPSDVTDRQSGTGGFVLMADSGMPVLRDLNDPAVRKELDIDSSSLGVFTFVPMRVRTGEDAGCLNLNRAQQPRLLGVRPQALAARNAFPFAKVLKGESLPSENGWDLLDADLGPDVVPAIGDVATVHWGLGLGVGDTLQQYDEDGRPFKLRIVAMLSSSVLQGSLLISDKNFTERFPSVPGYRMFMIDAQPEKAVKLTSTLTLALRRYGMEVLSTRDKLAAFNAVENTYLAIFLVLGGLGLLLGTVGLGLVVWLNILDRRGELAMMQAVGFDKPVLMIMLQTEHAVLLAAGVLAGTVAALLAVAPALAEQASVSGIAGLLIALAVIVVSGWIWIRLASAAALAGTALDALRNE